MTPPDQSDQKTREHIVRCPYCAVAFDLFREPWCEHQGGGTTASKTCPGCGRCMCDHPAYDEPLCWTEAPAAFQDRGFARLFLLYL